MAAKLTIIDPITVTDAILTSSSVYETTVTEYNGATTYALGDVRGVTTGTVQVIYESLQNSNTGNAPASSSAWWKQIGTVYATYSGAATYALDDIVTSVSTDVHQLYRSLAGGNTGNALTDATKWQYIGVTNRWKMFDGGNATQTENPEYIEVELTPAAIATGVYLGNVEGDSVTITVTDPVDGEVYTETQSLIISNSGSSFYNWAFRRIKRKTLFFSLKLPPYVDATVKIRVDKSGGTAKIGMCCLGPQEEVGLSQSGVSADFKDYSSTTFNADGTSETVERGYAKRMSIDVVIDNDLIDSVQNTLIGYRQTPVVWIGSSYEITVMYGKFSGLKTVIPDFYRSKMALQIEGMV